MTTKRHIQTTESQNNNKYKLNDHRKSIKQPQRVKKCTTIDDAAASPTAFRLDVFLMGWKFIYVSVPRGPMSDKWSILQTANMNIFPPACTRADFVD